jgi:hypothetical protein
MTWAFLRISCARHESGALEDSDVFRNGSHRDVKRLCQLPDRRIAFCQARQDLASRRVGQCPENQAQAVFGLLLGTTWFWNHMVLYSTRWLALSIDDAPTEPSTGCNIHDMPDEEMLYRPQVSAYCKSCRVHPAMLRSYIMNRVINIWADVI